MCYLSKRGIAHIQHEFNTTRQKPGKSARGYGLRLDKLAMELYQSMTEGKEYSPDQRKAILDTIQELVLENFQLGLRDDIQTIVRSRNYKTLMAAISGVIAEEKLKGFPSRINYKTKEQDQFRQGRNTGRMRMRVRSALWTEVLTGAEHTCTCHLHMRW